MKQIYKYITGFFLFLPLVWACTDSQEEVHDSVGKQGVVVDLSLTSIPLQGCSPVTRSVGKGMEVSMGNTMNVPTRAVEESKINNLCVFQFEGTSKESSSATLISMTYVTDLKSTVIPVTLVASQNYFLYVCVNVGDIRRDFTVNRSTYQDMMNSSFKTSGQTDFSKALPMSGCSELYGADMVRGYIKMTLTRMLAKVSFICKWGGLPSGDSFTIMSVKLRNVSQTVKYVPLDMNTKTVEVDSYEGTGSVDVTSKMATYEWYIPENKRGNKAGATSWLGRIEKNAPNYSSYIEVIGNYTPSGGKSYEVTYAIYLGDVSANNYTNYDVVRNHHYSVTSQIKGGNLADLRLTEYTNLSADGLANCYLAGKDNHKYRFNGTVRGNGQTEDYAALQYPGLSLMPTKVAGAADAVTIPSEQIKDAVVVWETAAGLISKISWNAASGCVLFETGTAKGNALIAVRNASGDILWSWHIWRTNNVDLATLNARHTLNIKTNTDHSWYTELPGVGVAAGRKRDLTILDRNIGASFDGNNIEGNQGVYCLHYQFGRKDPFPAGTVYNSNYGVNCDGDVSLYGYATGQKVEFKIYPDKLQQASAIGNSAKEALEYVIKHPEIYVCNENPSSFNWMVNATLNADDWKVSNCLWGDNNLLNMIKPGYEDYIYVDPNPWDGEKTIYDPSPAGWRVAPADTWTGIVANDVKWGYPSINDIYKDGDWAAGWWVYFNGDKNVKTFLPASGLREPNGRLNYFKFRIMDWLSSPCGLNVSNSINGTILNLAEDDPYGVYAITGNWRVRGFLVRCALYRAQ